MQKNISEVGCLYPIAPTRKQQVGKFIFLANFLVPEKIMENYIPKLLMEETKKW